MLIPATVPSAAADLSPAAASLRGLDPSAARSSPFAGATFLGPNAIKSNADHGPSVG
jgi:hypothetical protein